jgi:cell wall-associated NlpC family hydrolase
MSTITPSKSKDNIKKSDIQEKNETTPMENNISLNTPSQEIIQKQITLLDQTPLDDLASLVLKNLDTKIDGNSNSTTEPLEVGENWEVLTKEDEIIETAKEFLGVKYVWAANGPDAFDCSGFTKYVFEKHGITIPRYSGYQANIGTKVTYDELQKGDLVFFDTDKKGKVNHVGIYLGDHQFIHASSGGKRVMITSFIQKKFYRNRFLHGQRIVHSDRSLAL